MSWEPIWEQVFLKQEWGQYPPEELIRFVARNFYGAPDRKEIRILELGCGPGANVWYLAREGFEAHGIDGSKTAIANAGRRMHAEGLTANLQVGDIMFLDQMCPKDHFDAVIDISCLQHNKVSAVDSILQQALHVLKPHGKIFAMMVTTGTLGDGMGQEVEPGSFVGNPSWHGASFLEVPLHGEALKHYFTLEEIQRLFARFIDVQIDSLLRSMSNRQYWYKQFLVEGTKPL